VVSGGTDIDAADGEVAPADQPLTTKSVRQLRRMLLLWRVLIRRARACRIDHRIADV
jgi:hypothetical protein